MRKILIMVDEGVEDANFCTHTIDSKRKATSWMLSLQKLKKLILENMVFHSPRMSNQKRCTSTNTKV